MGADELDKWSEKMKGGKIRGSGKDNKYLTIIDVLRNHDNYKGLFKYNLMKEVVEFAQVPYWDHSIKPDMELRDVDVLSVKVSLGNGGYAVMGKDLVYECILQVSRDRRYHEIRDYLAKLVWDGKPRLDTWLIELIGAEDTIVTRAVSRKVMVALVARVHEPGVKFDNLMILEGKQGIGKSMLIENLVGKKFYTTVSFHNNDKEIVEAMRGKWCLEFDEMADIRKADVERVKSLLSRNVDRMRMSYGRLAEDFPRQSVMIGTINPRGSNKYLQDDTGNRRFWPIPCFGKLKLDDLLAVRDQLFAEAMHLYKAGEALWLDNHEVASMATAIQLSRVEEDPHEELIEEYLKLRVGSKITNNQIMEDCLKLAPEKRTKAMSIRIGVILKGLGWEVKRSNIGERGRYYIYPQAESAPEPVSIPVDQIKWEE